MDKTPMFSRSITGGFKCDTDLDTKVPEQFKLAWAQLASQADCTPSELLRDWVCFRLHGVTFTEYVTKHRRAALGLPDPIESQPRPSLTPQSLTEGVGK